MRFRGILGICVAGELMENMKSHAEAELGID
jgi:hypothetical protein